MGTIIDILNDNAGELCNKPVLRYNHQSLPYSFVLDSSDKFAQGLRNLNLKQGDNIVLLLPIIPELFTAYYGILKSRCRVIPLNYNLKTADLKHVIENSDVEGIIFWDRFERKIISILDQLDIKPTLIQVGKNIQNKYHDFSEVVNSSDSIGIDQYPQEDDEAVILYSSGTTGYPKGAVLTHKSILSSAQAVINRFSLTRADKILAVLSVNHYLSLDFILHAGLICGSEILLHSNFDVVDIPKSIKSNKATVIVGTPLIFSAIIEQPDLNPEDFSTLRLCVASGFLVDDNIVNEYSEKLNLSITQCYGCVETTSVISVKNNNEKTISGSIGVPFESVEIKIIDEEGMECLYGETGEMAINSPMNMKRYFALNPSPGEENSKQWVYPGDMCKWDKDGNLEIWGHKEDIINKGNYKVYPVEVEKRLLEHPDVREVAVMGIDDKLYVQEVKAFIVLRENRTVSKEELLDHCKKSLPVYKCPGYIDFVPTLPRNISGAVVRRHLPKSSIYK